MMKGWFEIKVRAKLCPEDTDDKEVTILGQTVRWQDWGIEYEANEEHKDIVMTRFGFDDKTKRLTGNGCSEVGDRDEDDENLVGGEATSFRAIAARINFLAQYCPDL